MKINDLNKIKNPLDDKENLEKIITAYANSSLSGFYDMLTRQNSQNNGQYYISDFDEFQTMLFNKWKNSIVNMSQEDFLKAKAQRLYEDDFIILRNYLRTVPDAKTAAEVSQILHGSSKAKALREAIDKYHWAAKGQGTGWNHIISKYLTAGKDEFKPVEHRLYINPGSMHIYKFLTYFVLKCEEQNIPFYFKYVNSDRDDGLVIYASTDLLETYLNILEQIAKEHPKMVANFSNPPILTGKVKWWLGYGSEPKVMVNGEKQSFNSLREILLRNVLHFQTINWLLAHQNMLVNYNNETLYFKDYFYELIKEAKIAEMRRYYNLRFSYNLRANSRNAEVLTTNELGYNLTDLNTIGFEKALLNHIKQSVVLDNDVRFIPGQNLIGRNNQKISISFENVELTLKKLTYKIYKNDQSFGSSILEQIKVEAPKYGISPSNFSFDTQVLKQLDKIPKPLSKIEEFVANLNPEILKLPVKLPNGKITTAENYLRYIVMPFIPSNGVIILQNGAFITAKQFVEEGAFGECQEKYNGDFVKYYMENVQNNVGVININNQNIKPEAIIESINPTLLEKIITLPTGLEISGREYLQEYYVPYMPMDGKVILSNNSKVSIKQYIEEILLGDALVKFQGDIQKTLYYTTKNNAGYVDCDIKSINQTISDLQALMSLKY